MISPAPKPKTAAQREIGLLASLDDLGMLSSLRWSDLAPPDPDVPPQPLCWEAGWDEPALLAPTAPLPSRRPAPRIEATAEVAEPAPAALTSKSAPLSSPPASVRARPKLTLEDYRKHRRDGR